VEFFGALSGVDRPTRRRRAGELIETVGMNDAADRRVGTYSKGQAQRIGLAQALVNDPDLVLLDEPTDGVDPVGRRDIRDVLLRLRTQGKTVFINSHLLSELEMICDRVAILVAGRVATQGTLDDLTLSRQCYEIETVLPVGRSARPLSEVLGARIDSSAPPPYVAPVMSPAGPPAFPVGGPPPLPPRAVQRGVLPSGDWVEIDGPVLRSGLTDPVTVQPLIDALRAAGVVIFRMQLVRPSLEDLFIEAVAANPALPTTGGDRR
jgi:ABC-2 type transport system ATP-binding protein